MKYTYCILKNGEDCEEKSGKNSGDDDDTQTQMQRSARLESSPPPQFDSSDLGSPKKVWSLLCTKDETYRRDPRLFQRQRKINAKMRSMLFDWLMDVCADKHMHRETFHLCVDYFDRYIALDEQVAPNRLQLIGATALIIASKIEEIYPPKVSEIADYTDGCCEEQDLRDLEEVMLQRLHWKCYPITAVHWLALYMQLMNTCDVLPARQVILTAEKPIKKEPKAPEKTIKKEEHSRTPEQGDGGADEEEDVDEEPIAVAYMPTSNFSYDELPSLNVSIVSEMEEEQEQTPPHRLLEQYQKQLKQQQPDNGSSHNGKQPKLELLDMSYEEAGMSTATAAVVVVKQEPAEEETETENHKPPAASASAMDQGQNSPSPNRNNNSIVSTPKAVIKANNTSSISGGGGNNNTNDKHHHHRRRVLTFSTVCPRMQLGRIGGSPRVLLHTAMADISYVGHSNYSAGHIYPDQRCTVPKLMRGEFVRLASILDLVTLDASSLRYTYRELATAVLLCSYEPEHLICQITGLPADKLRDVRDFVDPFVQLFEQVEPAGTAIPCLPKVEHSDRHNIQTYMPQCLAHLETVEIARKQNEHRRKMLEMATQRVSSRERKRKFGATLNGGAGLKSHEV